VATECDESSSSDTTRTPSPIDDHSRPKRMTRPPDRYGEWEFKAVMSSDLPPVLGMKLGVSEGSSGHRRIEYSSSKKIIYSHIYLCSFSVTEVNGSRQDSGLIKGHCKPSAAL